MFAVMVKPAARKRICTSGLVWVKDDQHEFYVSMKERGLWPTKADAEKMITEPWEIAVEVHNVGVQADRWQAKPDTGSRLERVVSGATLHTGKAGIRYLQPY